MEVSGNFKSQPLHPRERASGIPRKGGLVGPAAGLHFLRKIKDSCPRQEWNLYSLILQAVFYPLHNLCYLKKKIIKRLRLRQLLVGETAVTCYNFLPVIFFLFYYFMYLNDSDARRYLQHCPLMIYFLSGLRNAVLSTTLSCSWWRAK